MTYPFTPELLDALPEELAELFRSLEITLLEEICERLKIADNLNEVTVQDIRALRSIGIDLNDIKKAISKTSEVGMDKLDKLFGDVVARNQKYYGELVDLAEITKPERLIDETDLDAIKRQTKKELTNLTQSMGFLVTEGGRKIMQPPAKAYQWALDNAETQVFFGGISYREAIKNAVKQLADSGIRQVDYESGHVDQVDVAVRRAVMTGINQICQKYAEQSVEYLETDLVEVSAHQGARDTGIGPENHKEWQGKVYRWIEKPGNSKGEYPGFIETTGYGTGEGLGGWNCRHHFYPFYEGVSERTYTDEQLANIDPPPFAYQGKEYTAYEATQKQRMIERTVRKLTRRREALKSAGLNDEAQDVNARIRRLKAEYTNFSKAAGLPEQQERMKAMYVDDKSKLDAAKLLERRTAEAPIREAIKRGDYDLTINPDKQARHMEATATPGRSVITISSEELQSIITANAGDGKISLSNNYIWKNQEIIDAEKEIGYTINKDGVKTPAWSIKIHYSNTGVHAVPYSRRWKK